MDPTHSSTPVSTCLRSTHTPRWVLLHEAEAITAVHDPDTPIHRIVLKDDPLVAFTTDCFPSHSLLGEFLDRYDITLSDMPENSLNRSLVDPRFHEAAVRLTFSTSVPSPLGRSWPGSSWLMLGRTLSTTGRGSSA